MKNKFLFFVGLILIAILVNLSNAFTGLISSFLIQSCDKTSLKFSTEKSKLPDNINWTTISFGKEIINILQGVVVISGGSHAITKDEWNDFHPNFPWLKNIDRNLLFNKSYFIRSPDKKVDCGNDCLSIREYKSYTWVDLAKPICVSFYPSKTDLLKPAKGHLVIKTIIKCHAIYFENFIYQLTDNKGNFYAMHAFEDGEPNMSVELPEGWTLKKVELVEPLIISPFGGGDFCYHNIVGDNLGQGYHQYIFTNSFYP